MKGLLKQSFSKFMKESAYRAEMTLYFNFAIKFMQFLRQYAGLFIIRYGWERWHFIIFF